jgi:hypothetical protein
MLSEPTSTAPAAWALALPLDDARAERVAGHLVLSAAFAQALEAYPLRPVKALTLPSVASMRAMLASSAARALSSPAAIARSTAAP